MSYTARKIPFFGHQVEIDYLFNKLQSILILEPVVLKSQFTGHFPKCTIFYESANYNTIVLHYDILYLQMKIPKISSKHGIARFQRIFSQIFFKVLDSG